MTQPTGVFVRLPLSDELREAFITSVDCGEEVEAGIAAIGTPVTGGELKTMAHISRGGDRISIHRKTERDIPLVRQSDAIAKLAEKDAEIVRLRTEDDKGLTQAIEERDECERVINDLYQAVMGDPPEWSNGFGYRDAVEDIVDYVHALRTKALKGPEA